jgi:hypothetical protein
LQIIVDVRQRVDWFFLILRALILHWRGTSQF